MQLVLELKPLKDKQHELSVELHGVKTTQKTALIEQTDMKSKQVLLQQRMAQVFGTSILLYLHLVSNQPPADSGGGAGGAADG